MEQIFEYIEDHAQQCIEVEEFFQLPKARLIMIVASQNLRVNELDLFRAVNRWVQAECERLEMKWTEENLREIGRDVLCHIRFPLMTLQEIASVVSPTNLLTPSQVLQIFTYLGAQTEDKPAIPFISTPRGANGLTFSWDATKSAPTVLISNKGLTVSSSSAVSQICAGNVVLRSGIHQWEVRLESVPPNSNNSLSLGVVPAAFNKWDLQGVVPGWIFLPGRGQAQRGLYARNAFRFGMRCGNGDRIGVLLNLDQCTMELFFNGLSMGVPFHDIIPPVRPVISLANPQRCTLNFDLDY